MCVCWRGAGNVQRRELFRPAFGCMERWSGHQHGCAPPPCVSGSCAHSCSGESGHKPCACAGAAQGMFYFASATYPVSECNRLLTHRSFIAQTPSAWASSNHDSWASASCPFLPPSLPPPPPSPPPLPPPPAGVFRDQGRLKFALGEWRDDAVSAQAAHGHISNWDVSAITDMSQLIGNSAIYSGDDDDDYVHYEGYTYYYGIFGPNSFGTVEEEVSPFDEDLNAWDVSRVTDMSVSCPQQGEGGGAGAGSGVGAGRGADARPTCPRCARRRLCLP